MFGKNKFNNVVINGQIFNCSGSNILIQGGQVVVDGKIIKSDLIGNVEVIINGDVNKIDCAGSVIVHGNAGSVDCTGSCKIDGDVHGDVDTAGSVACGNVMGDIDASGSVKCRR